MRYNWNLGDCSDKWRSVKVSIAYDTLVTQLECLWNRGRPRSSFRHGMIDEGDTVIGLVMVTELLCNAPEAQHDADWKV